MSQLKIKQINGLQSALDAKGDVGSASNQGAGQGLFKQETSGDLEFYTLGSGNAIVVASPATDVVDIDVDVNAADATKATPAVGADLVLIADSEDSNNTKKISVSNLVGSTSVDYSDFTSVSATADGDSIVFFDASNSNATQRQTKAEFLVEHAKLASPAFTGTPTAPTAAPGTDTTQLATTAFVKAGIDAALAGLDFQKDVIDNQVDATLDPGASPTTGDRYIIENSAALHANFGTITGVADDDIVEYDGADFVVVYDVSVEGEGAITWNQTDNEFQVYDGTSWASFGGLAGVTAGDGLDKTGNTLSVNVDDSSIAIVTDTLEIKSTWAGQTSITTVGTIGTGTWQGNEVEPQYGGTGLTTIAAHSILATSGAANSLAAVPVTTNALIGRKTGGISVFQATDIQDIAEVNKVVDEGTLTNGSMALITLSQTPAEPTKLQVYINGLLLDDVTDYTVSGTSVTATNALNVAYGGTAADGLGFESSDKIIVVYRY